MCMYTPPPPTAPAPGACGVSGGDAGVKAIAITDHDTMDGIEEAGKAGELMGVTIIPGIELSADYQGKEVHVLGYFLDENAPIIKEYQQWAQEKRQERNEKIVERLRKRGFEITMEQLREPNPTR